jgi:hypothetical protein
MGWPLRGIVTGGLRVGASGWIALVLTAAILVVTVWSWLDLGEVVVAAWGADFDFYLGVTQRWLSTGQFYQPHQLAGPYVASINVDTLYPPIALVLFLPFVWLPAALWWAIPLGIVAWSVLRSRPPLWVWPFLALMLWWPRTQSIIVWGGTGMWIAAALALATRFGWPGALVLLKPSLAPFALIGIRSRGWWVIAIAMAILSLPMLPDYVTALRNNVGSFPGIGYSVQDIPFLAIPLIAAMSSGRWPSRRGRDDHEGRAAAVTVPMMAATSRATDRVAR